MRMRCVLFVMCLVVLSSPGTAVAAQPPGAPAAEDAAAARPAAEKADPGSVNGLVLDRSGVVRPGVGVSLAPAADLADLRVVVSARDGSYAFTGVPAGTYQIAVLGDRDLPPARLVTVTAGQTTTHHLLRGTTRGPAFALVLLTTVLFAAGVLAYRHHNIVHTTRKMLVAQLENIETRLPLESNATEATKSSIACLADRIRAIKIAVPTHLGWQEWFFWSRGHEISGWISLHEVERQLIAFLVPESRVVERGVVTEAELRALNKPEAIVLADRLRVTLQQVGAAAGDATHTPEHLLDHLKQQLAEGLSVLYTAEDTQFASLMEWHNKAMWLVYLSLLSILALSLVFHHEELFLIGAVGGLMSRMARSLFREDLPTDYGASWTTLFLSPLLGAISAWAGIAVLAWLRDVQALGPQFDKVAWDAPATVWVITLGFALGFSERFFTSLLSKVEGRVTQELDRRPQTPPLALPPAPSPPSSSAAGQPADRTGAGAAAAGAGRIDRILAELDVQPGERAAYFGDAASSTRRRLVDIAGAASVVDVTFDALTSQGPFDAVLFESLPTIDQLAAAAPQLMALLRPDGRVVVVGRSSAALFDADAAAQRASAHLGPSLVHALLTAAGLSPQEPPAPLSDGNTIEWVASFMKPAAGGGDR